jgi:hypothetical protein
MSGEQVGHRGRAGILIHRFTKITIIEKHTAAAVTERPSPIHNPKVEIDWGTLLLKYTLNS